MPHLSPHHTPLRLPYAFTVPSLVTFPLTLVCHPCTPPVSPHTHPDLHCFMPSTVTALTNPPVAMNTCLGPACLPCTHVWALHACHGA